MNHLIVQGEEGGDASFRERDAGVRRALRAEQRAADVRPAVGGVEEGGPQGQVRRQLGPSHPRCPHLLRCRPLVLLPPW